MEIFLIALAVILLGIAFFAGAHIGASKYRNTIFTEMMENPNWFVHEFINYRARVEDAD